MHHRPEVAFSRRNSMERWSSRIVLLFFFSCWTLNCYGHCLRRIEVKDTLVKCFKNARWIIHFTTLAHSRLELSDTHNFHAGKKIDARGIRLFPARLHKYFCIFLTVLHTARWIASLFLQSKVLSLSKFFSCKTAFFKFSAKTVHSFYGSFQQNIVCLGAKLTRCYANYNWCFNF